MDQSENIVIENAHTPIIDYKTFAYTQEQLKLRSKGHYRGQKKYAADYSGFMVCGDCGSPMFSMSRPDLAPAYVCGAYHVHGLKACTSHHIRVEVLDALLKRYLVRARDNSAGIMEKLEQAIREQPDREEDIGKSIDTIQSQLEQTKEQLKNMYKRKLLDTIGKAPETAAIIEETYVEIEKELTDRIRGLEEQIEYNNNLRNNMIVTNRAAKTVLDVFDDLLKKPNLDKQDIGLIVEKIVVYDDHLDVKLKPEIDMLITNMEDTSINFSQDSKDVESETIVQKAIHQKDRVFTVNVISEGDPLEIFTERDGEVIFKKYSPMGDMQDYAGKVCETLGRHCKQVAAVADRDGIIAQYGSGKRELMEKNSSHALQSLMEQRVHYLYEPGKERLPAVEGEDKFFVEAASPVLCQGDLLGCVMVLGDGGKIPTEQTRGQVQLMADLLGRQMEM